MRGLSARGTDCMKWDGMLEEHHDPDMVPMWVADMDFPSAPAIREAVQKVVDQGTWGYTMSGEADACALRDYWKRRHGVSFEPKDVLMGPCVVSELRLCVRALTEPGDGVLIFTPVYGPFYASIKESGRRIVESPMARDALGRYTLNLVDAEGKLAAAKRSWSCSARRIIHAAARGRRKSLQTWSTCAINMVCRWSATRFMRISSLRRMRTTAC